MSYSKLLASLLSIVLICGCQTGISEDDAELPKHIASLVEAPEWILKAMTHDGEKLDLVKGGRITISFTGTKLHGDSGVNSFDGAYSALEDGTFRHGGLSGTEMGGDSKLMEQEMQFIKVFSRANRVEIKDGVLVFSDGTNKNRLEFVPHAPPALPLIGTNWNLTNFEENDDQTSAATPVLEGHPISLLIKDSKATGSGGCNRYTGEVKKAKDGEVEFLAPASTRKACKPEVNKQESRFFNSLPKMTQYTIRESHLVLSNEDETLVLHFEGKVEDADETDGASDGANDETK